MRWMETQTWAKVCVHLTKTIKRQRQQLTTKRETTKKKDLQCMKVHALTSTTLTDSPSVSHHFTHIVGLFALYFVSSIQFVAVPLYSISDLYANSLKRCTLRKRVFWGVVCTHERAVFSPFRPPRRRWVIIAAQTNLSRVWYHRRKQAHFHLISYRKTHTRCVSVVDLLEELANFRATEVTPSSCIPAGKKIRYLFALQSQAPRKKKTESQCLNARAENVTEGCVGSESWCNN